MARGKVLLKLKRKARVRLDVVAMLIYRLAYASLVAPSFYLWTDSSPQWEGLDFRASSFDVDDCGAL